MAFEGEGGGGLSPWNATELVATNARTNWAEDIFMLGMAPAGAVLIAGTNDQLFTSYTGRENYPTTLWSPLHP